MKNLIKLLLLIIGLGATSLVVRAQQFPGAPDGFSPQVDPMSTLSTADQNAVYNSQADPATWTPAQKAADEVVVDLLSVLIAVPVAIFEYIEIMEGGAVDFEFYDNPDNMADIYDYPDYDHWGSGMC